MASNYEIADALVSPALCLQCRAGHHSKSPVDAPTWHSHCYHSLHRKYDPMYNGT